MEILDISDPLHLSHVGACDLQTSAGSVWVFGNYACLSGGWGGDLGIIDVSNPRAPQQVGSYASCFAGLYDMYVVQGNLLLALNCVGLEAIDVSVPSKPARIGSYPLPAGASSLFASDQNVYVAGEGGLQILALAPLLHLGAPMLTPEGLFLTWTGGTGRKLQKTATLSNPNWQDIPGSSGTNLMSLPATDGASFFRLSGPR